MRTKQNYDPTPGSATPCGLNGQNTPQTVYSDPLTANRALLRHYLDEVFYPRIFPPDATTEPQPQPAPGKGDELFGDFQIDLSDFELDLSDFELGLDQLADLDMDVDLSDPEDACVCYSPVQRVLMLHRLFVTFLGHRQGAWWKEYTAELVHFFGECGEPPVIVQQTLREPLVSQTLRHFN